MLYSVRVGTQEPFNKMAYQNVIVEADGGDDAAKRAQDSIGKPCLVQGVEPYTLDTSPGNGPRPMVEGDIWPLDEAVEPVRTLVDISPDLSAAGTALRHGPGRVKTRG